MPGAGRSRWRRLTPIVLAVALVMAIGALLWRDDILRTALDPRVPFQTYSPPPAPDYTRAEAWARLPASPEQWTMADLPLDVFFVHPTTYDGGREWNAPVDHAGATRRLDEVMLPNHAGPYQAVGRVFAPRYRQASLYTRLTLRDDAREARRFAYEDVRAAFRLYLARYNRGRPFLLVGVEQGGDIAGRLLRDEVARDPALLARMAGAHLIGTVTPEAGLGAPACERRAQARCVLAFASVGDGNDRAARRLLERGLVWDGMGHLVNLPGPALCVNPLTGGRGGVATPQANLGAANATGLEWGLRPGFMPRQVGAACRGGVLHVTRPESPSLRPGWGWAERRRAPAFNLFYADLEADAKARLKALDALGGFDRPAPPIGRSVSVEHSPIHRID
jgi:hypothetical protein